MSESQGGSAESPGVRRGLASRESGDGIRTSLERYSEVGDQARIWVSHHVEEAGTLPQFPSSEN